MKRRTALSLLVGGLASRALAQSPPKGGEDPDFTIQTTSRLVLLDVSVTNKAGGFVSGLSKDDFKVFENGKRQEITQFANADIPVTAGILVDASGSMRPKRAEVVTAALSFIGASNPQDEVFVINFNEKPYLGLPGSMPFTDDIKLLRTALWRTPAEGRTSLYDALLMGLQQIKTGHRDKRTLIVLTDGGDNASAHTFKDAMNDVLESLATIYTIGIFDEDDPDRNPGVLSRLAHVSGGEVFFPKKLEEIEPICQKIAKDIRTRYTIGYIPAMDNGKGIRHIKAEVSAPNHEKLTARTRTSYMFSEQAGDHKG